VKNQVARQIFNVLLRVASLAAKLLLTLFMGRYLGLEDLGLYGLVFSAVMISTTLLGVRLDYVVGRDLIKAPLQEGVRLMRDQLVFLGFNYIFLALVLLGMGLMNLVAAKWLLSIFIISVFECTGNAMTNNLISLGKPVLSTFLFFVRSGLWGILVVVIGLLFPSTRNVPTILFIWGFGAFLGVVMTFWAYRHYPFRAVLHEPIDWVWIKKSVIGCFPIWIGTVCATLSYSVDRFVVSSFMTISDVGVITYYGSFATALLSLTQSGIYSFSYPKMIRHHHEQDETAFWREARDLAWQVSLFVFFLVVVTGIVIPYSGVLFNKPEFQQEAVTLWLMLLGIWIRGNADTLYYVLYARHEDKPLWVGSLLFLIPAVGGNLLFVPLFGLEGVGYSSILGALFLLVQRGLVVFRVKDGRIVKKNPESKAEAKVIRPEPAEILDP
jgi:O-antigen/teichoic acid export membrane protein